MAVVDVNERKSKRLQGAYEVCVAFGIVPVHTVVDGCHVLPCDQCLLTEDTVFIHPTSVLSRTKPGFVVFQELFETRKLYMRSMFLLFSVWV